MNTGEEILQVLAQFGGEGGRPGNVAVRFLLPAFFWLVLAVVASREHRRTGGRKDLYIGIAALIGIGRELFVFMAEYGSLRGFISFDKIYPFYPPLEHAGAMLSSLLIAASFLNYFPGWQLFSRRYFYSAVAATTVLYAFSGFFWPSFLREHPGIQFGFFEGDVAFHLVVFLFLAVAWSVFLLNRIRGVRVQVALLLGFLFLMLDDLLMLVNLATASRQDAVFAPIRHNLHIWAIPLFLGVYWTDLKYRLQRALEATNQERLRSEAIIAAIGDGITIQDRDFRILYQNQIDKDFMGDHAGTLCYEAYRKRTRPCEDCPIARAFIDGNVHRSERTLASPGGPRYFEITASPLKDSTGRIIAGIEVIRDVTESRRMREEVAKSQKLESVGLLAGGLAHDFNNLLTTIYGNIGLAKLSLEAGHESHATLEAAERATLRATDVTRQLLTFSKGGAPIRKAASIAEIARDSVTFTLSGSNVKAEFVVAPGLSPVHVDAGQMSQVFNNLALNALQAMPNGGTIRITMDCVQASDVTPPLAKPGAYVRVVVTDTGIGIPADLLPKIFDPYFTTKQKGSGLGLTTVYSIVKKHDGYIKVHSQSEAGTSFHLYLPASDAQLLPITPARDKLVTGRGMVLVMDDEAGVREAAGAMLKKLGYDCSYAADGNEAVSQYKKAKAGNKAFDLVIMDLTIPGGMGGRETVTRLLALDPNATVIVSSGYSNDPVMAEYEQYGFKGVLSKPYNLEHLDRVLRAVVRPGTVQ